MLENEDEIVFHATKMFQMIGIDFLSSDVKDTPRRFVRAISEITKKQDFDFSVFDAKGYSELIVEGGVDFFTLCEHHMLPFFGKVSIGYIPKFKIAGISKLARTVNFFSASPNTQEYLTKNILNFIVDKTDPLGAGVIITGKHLCQSMRGCKLDGLMTTSSYYGEMNKAKYKEEFARMSHIK